MSVRFRGHKRVTRSTLVWINVQRVRLMYSSNIDRPPEDVKIPEFGSIHGRSTKNPSLRVVRQSFPEFLTHSAIDLYCERQHLNNELGIRRSPEEIYGKDPALSLHYELITEFINMLQPKSTEKPVIVLYGSEVKKWFAVAFTTDNELTINGRVVSLSVSIIFPTLRKIRSADLSYW